MRASGGMIAAMHVAAGEVQRRHEIIGNPFGAQLVQDAVIHDAIRIGEAAAERFAGFGHMHHRAFEKGPALKQLEAAVGDLGAGLRMPDEPAADDLRMQRADEHHDPPQRQSGRDQALTQLGQHFVRQRRIARAVDEPLDDRMERNWTRRHRLTPGSNP
jgi:hypothetical protein